MSLVSWFPVSVSLHILFYADTFSWSGCQNWDGCGNIQRGKPVISWKQKICCECWERFREMTSSTKSSWHDIMITLSDAVKNHIRARHLYPRKQGKSCFLSVSEIPVWKMVEETFLYPDVSTPHRSDENKIVLRKKFYWPVGIHGRNGALCFSVTVIYDWLNRRIITAFPTTWIFKTFIFKFAKRNSNIWEICGCRTKSRESWLGPKSLFSLSLRLEVCSMSGNYFKTVIQYSGWAIFGVCPR